jgi:hypothetical protein
MKTQLNNIKDMAKMFLRLPIKTDKKLPQIICVYHPFIASSVIHINGEFVDIMENPEKLQDFYNIMDNEIDSGDLYRIYALVRRPYRLTFIKHCEPYLSSKDLAELFADAWVSSENPNQDINCSIPYLTKMFKKCDKKHLMTEEDYQIYEQLPETLTLYRGVAVGRNPKGLSWTQNLKTAKWFAHRFDNDNEKGYIQMTTAKKEDVLAYFNTRNEDEIVYNSRKSKISIYEEV